MKQIVSSLIGDNLEENRYLLFRLAENIYATPLLAVREVVEAIKPQAVPDAQKGFLGVIEIRGQVVGVEDLRIKFGHPLSVNPHLALLVFDTPNGPKAALVDKVESVQRIPSHLIDKKPNINSLGTDSYIQGIARINNQLITLLDLVSCLTGSKTILNGNNL
jgi:purine-binding chemotaxis protein CheW